MTSLPLLFVVGVPRSGTTLLRELLSQHPRVGITPDELQGIPQLLSSLGTHPDFRSPETLETVSRWVTRSNFQTHMDKKGIGFSQSLLADDLERRQVDSWEGFLRCFLSQFIPGVDSSGHSYVGDKTPNNLLAIEQIHRCVPNVRFIHIIRDPRDSSLSARTVWGKSLYRAAARWRTYVDHYFDVIEDLQIADKCHLVRYEDLVSSPELTLRGICHFLEVEYDPKMCSPRAAAEQLGDAAGASNIVAGNTQKFQSHLKPSEIKMVETVCFQRMTTMGYPTKYAEAQKPVNKIRYCALGPSDLVRSTCSQIRQKGVFRGIAYRLRQIG